MNRVQAKFCQQCGHVLADACPQCGVRTPDGALYCDQCAFPLAVDRRIYWPIPLPLQPRRQAKSIEPLQSVALPIASSRPIDAPIDLILARFLPRELAAKLESARSQAAMVGERRVVTMLFCDVKGSTAAAEQLDPEEWSEVINGAFEQMIKPVYKYEGTVARLMGDGILAFFGAPIAHEDDPQRAVLAGLEIVAGVQKYREVTLARWRLPVDVRVGINTGSVVVGAVGSDLRMEYTALGDAINLAARMEQTAEPGTVQIAEETYKVVAPLFDVETLDAIEVKGKAERVRAYRVLRGKAEPGRLRGIEGLESQLVGRRQEVENLQRVLGRLEQGVGAIVLLVGEAGIGKSRLVREARSALPGFALTAGWFQLTSPSYAEHQPYSLLRSLLECLVSAPPASRYEVLQPRLAELVEELEEERRKRAWQVLDMLFGQSAELEGEAFRAELFAVLLELIERKVSGRKVVLSVDDAHWNDAGSIDFLGQLFSLTERQALVLLCTLRPDREAPSWRLRALAENGFSHRLTLLTLQPLSTGESRALIDTLLSSVELPDALRTRILAKAGGNPFFVEEAVRALIEMEVVRWDEERASWRLTRPVDDIVIPDHVQALLVARIDRLEEKVRRTLQLASVIGRSFYYRVLQAVSAGDVTLDGQLTILQQDEIINEAARLPEREYEFRHALTQEAAYNMILVKQRRDYHRVVGEALESLYPDDALALSPALAHHFDAASRPDRAIPYYITSGGIARRMYALADAVTYYRRGLEMALQDRVATTEQLALLFTELARTYELDSRFEEADALYRQMEARAKEDANDAMLLDALLGRGKLRATVTPLFDPKEGRTISGRALELARQAGNRVAEVRALWNLANCERFVGTNSAKAIEYGEEALAIARDLGLRTETAYLLHDLSDTYGQRGEFEKGDEVIVEAAALWRELENRPMLADSLTTRSIWATMRGNYNDAIALTDDAYQISVEIGNPWGIAYSRGFSGVPSRSRHVR
ncbi:MAG: AAA family ATPase [Caldilineaceae bacterium]|nr:AAA family ATPase [Caldilineaceae bacterium]